MDASKAAGSTTTLSAPTTPGQLLDRITILRIKVQRVTDPARRASVAAELKELTEIFDRHVARSPELAALEAELQQVNEGLWDVEDALRLCEANAQFDARFVELARSVYKKNDYRFDVKRRIDVLLGSSMVEQKVYQASKDV